MPDHHLNGCFNVKFHVKLGKFRQIDYLCELFSPIIINILAYLMLFRSLKYRLCFIVTVASVLFTAGTCEAGEWYKEYNDSCSGINLQAALDYLKARKMKPRRQVVVAVIDGGMDTTALDLRDALWCNPREKKDGKDNDGNGYVDDLHGWNFLGTADGSFNMTSAGTEEYREFKRLYPKYKDADTTALADPAEYQYYKTMRKKAGIDSYLMFYGYAGVKNDAYQYIDSVLTAYYKPARLDTLTIGGIITTLDTEDQKLLASFEQLGTDIMRAGKSATWKSMLKQNADSYALMSERIHGIEHTPDKRLLMGDDLKDANDIYYGNSCLTADGCEHGTFVAAVIAGQGVINPGVSGIYPDARIMVIRAAPDGDEYDKDIATSVRYAVDNGAQVINMSFGKKTSPDSAMVNDAIAYALKHDVVILQAAGNNSLNIEDKGYYPSAIDADGKAYANFVRVGASDRSGAKAGISNYGVTKVDLFAPGSEITGNDRADHIDTASGTSLAAPMVSGIAALLRAYFPKLTAPQIKEILVRSCRPDEALAGTCRAGGVVDALNAVQIASTYK